MAKAETSEVFSCRPEQLFAVLTDYSKYPEFLAEVKNIEILKKEGSRKLVEYSVSVIKEIKYRLWMSEKPYELLEWEFAGGEAFKTMRGHWKLAIEGDQKTRADYFVEATFGIFVPGPIANALIKVNLPNMMASYHKRVKELYG
jgi:ribosome-associated toxin RatA of RatAB toxin-antitoxin module